MDIIAKNPYRYLGVYSNSPIKERVANKGKMNAFLKVGKTVSFPLDLPNILPNIDRTVETVANAESELTLPIDQIRFAQFWWMSSTPLDSIAFNHLMVGNVEMAKTIWNNKNNVSSFQNNFVLACISEDWVSAIRYAEILYSCFSEDFIAQVIGDCVSIETPLWQMLIDSLFEAKVDMQSFTNVITNGQWRNYIAEKTINPLIDSVTNAIETAKASRGKGATARLQAGEKLMASTKSSLTQLKKNLPASDIRYQTIADKLGLAILQCGIDYFNGSEAKDAAQKAMKLQSYAQSIVVGKMAKDRCKENVDILKKIIDSLPPQEVFTEANAVQDELRRANSLPDKTCHSITLLTNTKPHLQAIKIKLGSTNSFYLKLSTQVVNVALYNVIEEVNALQNDPTFKLNMIVDREVALSSLRTVLRIAWKATTIMDGFDMEVEFKSNRYNTNRQSLKNMCEQVGLSTTTYDGSRAPRIVPPTPDTVAPPTPPPSGKMPSWLAYLIGALLVGFIGALFNGGEGFVTGCILGLMFAGPILKAIFSED